MRKASLFLLLALFAGGAVFFLRPRTCEPISAAAEALRTEAGELYTAGKFEAAELKWKEFRQQLPAGECYDPERREAERNLQHLESRRKEPQVKEVKVQEVPVDFRPKPDEAARAVEFYQVGRRVRSVATLSAVGRGTFRDFGVKYERSFAYRYQSPLETIVKENNGGRIVFEQQVDDMLELLAVSDEQLQLDPPDSELLRTVGEHADGYASTFPPYRLLRQGYKLASMIDPKLKRSLTKALRFLRRKGVPVGEAADVDYAVRFKSLSGTRLRIHYVVGLGVTQIEAIDGKLFSEEELLRYAHNANVAVDYALQKDLDSAKGETFSLKVADVVSLINLEGFELKGVLEVAASKKSDVERLEFVGGKVLVSDPKIGGEAGAVVPKAGSYLLYDRNRHLITEAMIEWKVAAEWKSKDHLLFEGQKISSAEIVSNYSAQLIEAGK